MLHQLGQNAQSSSTPQRISRSWWQLSVSLLLLSVYWTDASAWAAASEQELADSEGPQLIAQSNTPSSRVAGNNAAPASVVSYPRQIAAATSGEAAANSVKIPTQILRTGVNIDLDTVSPNTLQLAQILNLTAMLQRIQTMREDIRRNRGTVTLESLTARQELNDAISEANQIIYKCDLEVDFTLAEITAEQNVYQEILGNYISSRDKRVLYANAGSFIANGALWAIGEAYDIPTYRYPRLSIPSGTISILAGVVPSIASMYALKAVDGKRTTSEVDPNMLAELFDYPCNPDTKYPRSIWEFLNAVPPLDKKPRKVQLVDRWISDANIPNFTDRKSKKQLDVLTASVAQKKALSIATLNTRQVMLTQLGAEILKMKRLLLELAMVVHGDKRI